MDTRLTYQCSDCFFSYLEHLGDNASQYKSYVKLAACYRSVDVSSFWLAAFWAGLRLGKKMLVYSFVCTIGFLLTLFTYAVGKEVKHHKRVIMRHAALREVCVMRDLEMNE